MSFHPGTGLVYIPAVEFGYDYRANAAFEFRPGRFNTGEDIPAATEGLEGLEAAKNLVCDSAQLLAWDPVRKRSAWSVTLPANVPGGVLSTAGGLVFQGHSGGELVAYDARIGRRLWAADVDVGIMAPPVTYSVDGEQYIAVLAGLGGSMGNHFADFDDVNDGRLVAFKLDGKAELPPVEARPPGQVAMPALDVPEERVALGRRLYGENCFWCHGMAATGSGMLPDLRSFVQRGSCAVERYRVRRYPSGPGHGELRRHPRARRRAGDSGLRVAPCQCAEADGGASHRVGGRQRSLCARTLADGVGPLPKRQGGRA